MNTQNWLDLNEFSSKYKVSLSTLRRRIRFGEIENFFKDGKYWLPDEPISKNARQRERVTNHQPKPAAIVQSAASTSAFPQDSRLQKFMIAADLSPAASIVNPSPQVQAPALTPQQAPTMNPEHIQPTLELNKLIAELKSAYVTVLHEKESQITQLKEEIADLKTLVKILESDNERLKDGMSLSNNMSSVEDTAVPLIKNWQLGDLDL